MKKYKILLTLAVIVVLQRSMLCADFFESPLVRPECYGKTQPGCHKELIDAYPCVRWSNSNLTLADTHFYMFTKDNPDNPELMHKCAGGLPPDTKFNPNCRTEIFIPGYLSGVCNMAIYRELKNERLKSGCYNVILVDYLWGNSFDLVEAKKNLPIVAKQLSIVIRKLKCRFKLTADKIMLTGHSFGAHIAGLVGQRTKVGKIVGLDPAGVVFTENTPRSERLDATDAPCVEVIHTNGGECLPGFFGCNFTCGTIDFWVNGGLYQQSCYNEILKNFVKQDYFYAIISLYPATCPHFQSVNYYKASMNPTDCQFVGVRCDSYKDFQAGKCRDCGKRGENCAVMGAYTCDCIGRCTKRGSYYLNTKDKCPYCDNSTISTNGMRCAATII